MKKIILVFIIFITSCKVPSLVQVQNKQVLPTAFNSSSDSVNTASMKWNEFFDDPYLIALIDTALKSNFELLSNAQDIEISKNNIRIKHADLLPRVNAAIGLGLEKTGRYTSQGAGNASTKIIDDQDVPEPIGDIFLGFKAGWEIDVWGKLHKAKKAAVLRYLKTVEGRNFIATNLVAEIANSYYELLALDNQLAIINEAVELQKNQLNILKIQKENARATELAVKQFQAQVYNSQSQLFDILQKIATTENKINYLLGRFPQPIARDKNIFSTTIPKTLKYGVPSQLLQNRPDIKQAEIELQASKLDVQIARAEFYPSVGITGMFGLNGFKPKYVMPTFENLAFNFVSEMATPIINRNAIIAEFKNANANQIAALYDYQKTILNSYLEVYNEMSNINNLSKYYEVKSKEAETLSQSIDVAKDLFQYARANYLEVLTVQRDALSAKLELIEAKKNQLIAVTNIYKALGGGWR
jgi:outer membrane protein, multidrug efflux system